MQPLGISDPLVVSRQPRPRWWLHILLLIATFITTSVMGAGFVRSFQLGEALDIDAALNGYVELLTHPSILLTGLPFSLTLLSILLAHELGHYLTCLNYGVAVTPPFFLPFPAPIGTFGAFIRILAPIYSRRTLFDIAVGGPVAGFLLLVPALIVGLANSKIIPGIAESGSLVFGTPLLVTILEHWMHPGTPVADIYLHPVARAAWVGILATALNLLPIGQLDGGHILYSFLGERSRWIFRVLAFSLVPLGLYFRSLSWLLWAAFLLFFGMRHPIIYDNQPLGAKRIAAAVLALVMLVLCFTVQPVR